MSYNNEQWQMLEAEEAAEQDCKSDTTGREFVFNSVDIGINYADSGPWRSYSLDSYGLTFQDLLNNATIEEIDQDGGTLRCYGLDECPTNEVYDRAYSMLLAFYYY